MPLGEAFCGWCGKSTYTTPQDAWAQINRIPKSRINRETLNVHPCPRGPGWHLHTSMRYGRKRKKRSS